MSLLPGRILPQTEPLGRENEAGDIIIDKQWWLLLYNICAQVLGTDSGNALPSTGVLELAALDADVADADAVSLRAAITNALILAQDALLQDPQQPPYLLAGYVNATNTNNTTLTGSNNDIQVGTTNGKGNQVIYLTATAVAYVTSIGYSLTETFTVGQIVQLVNVGLYSIQLSSTGSAVDPYRIEMPDNSLDLSGGSYFVRPAEVVTLEYMSNASLFPTSPNKGWVVTSAGIPNSAIQVGAGPSGPTALTIPANAKSVTVYFSGGGGGGGCGGTNSTSGQGGGGGGGGGISSVAFTSGNFPASLTVYAGGGGSGASTAGASGTAGGTSYVEWTDGSGNTYQINAAGGAFGTGGGSGSGTAGGTGGAGGAGTLSNGTAGGNGDGGGTAGVTPSGGSAGTAATGPQNTGGGGGGGFGNTSATTNGYAGGTGYPSLVYNSGTYTGGAGGTAPGGVGAKGLQSNALQIGSTGSGGGAGCVSAKGSAPDAQPGAGGAGGGGGKTVHNNSGAGGAGWYIVVTQG